MEVDRLHDVAREEQFDRPVSHHAHLAFESGEFAEIKRSQRTLPGRGRRTVRTPPPRVRQRAAGRVGAWAKRRG
jgi:hypothetical protein